MPRKSRWRQAYAPRIAALLHAHPEADEKQLRKLLREVAPVHMRGFHPYQMWLKEVRYQLNYRFRDRVFPDARTKPPPAEPGQFTLF